MSTHRCVVLAALALGCAPSPPSTEVFARPWPSEATRAADGTVDVADFPQGTGAPLRRDAEAALRGARGFALTAGIFFPFDVALDPASLPGVDESRGDEASVFVVPLDGGARAPIDVRFADDAGPFGGTNLLAILPYPGVPLAPDTRYAAVVTTRVRRASGVALPATIEAREVMDRLEAHAGIDRGEVAALTTFRTGDPTREALDAFADALAHDRPALRDAPTLVETHEDYCVYAAAIDMPVYQEGEPPYVDAGGGWARHADGALALQRTEAARVVITVPRSEAPDGRYPAAVFVRAGAGGDRPLVDRGPRDRDGASPPGTGLARELARAGYVAASVDGPLGGARNRAAWDEQFVLFNLLNPIALRDNIRQSALELALFAEVIATLDLDASGCPGASSRAQVRSDLTLIAHSNGATIAPIAAAMQPRYRALVMSGAGASWIRQVVHKVSPMSPRPFVSIAFGYGCHQQTFEHDPMLSYVQWAGEPADPLVYGPLLRDRHVLVFQGVLDTYIPPPIANPVALSLGLDLAGDALDDALEGYRPLSAELGLVERAVLPLPVQGNDAGFTRVVTQLPPDGIEDGHEVLFQQPEARAHLERFLSTLRDGAPVVASSE